LGPGPKAERVSYSDDDEEFDPGEPRFLTTDFITTWLFKLKVVGFVSKSGYSSQGWSERSRKLQKEAIVSDQELAIHLCRVSYWFVVKESQTINRVEANSWRNECIRIELYVIHWREFILRFRKTRGFVVTYPNPAFRMADY